MNDFINILTARLRELGVYVFQPEGAEGILASNGDLQAGLMFSGVNLALRFNRPIVTVMVYVKNTKREQDFMNTIVRLVDGLADVCIVQSATRAPMDKHYLVMLINVLYGG